MFEAHTVARRGHSEEFVLHKINETKICCKEFGTVEMRLIQGGSFVFDDLVWKSDFSRSNQRLWPLWFSFHTLVSGQWSVEYLSRYAPLAVCSLPRACRCSKERHSNLFNLLKLLHQVSCNRAGRMQLMQDLHAGDWALR